MCNNRPGAFESPSRTVALCCSNQQAGIALYEVNNLFKEFFLLSNNGSGLPPFTIRSSLRRINNSIPACCVAQAGSFEVIMDCYGNTESTYTHRDVPTRITQDFFCGDIIDFRPFYGMPDGNSYIDEYGPTPYGFWTKDDFALERKNWKQRNQKCEQYYADIKEKGWSHIDKRLFENSTVAMRIEVVFQDGSRKIFDDVHEAGEALGVTKAAVYKWCNKENRCSYGWAVSYYEEDI